MSLLAKCGSFTSPATASSVSVTGVGFLPKFVFIIGSQATSDGVATATATQSVGCSAGVGKDVAVGMAMSSGVSAANTARSHRQDACISFETTSGVQQEQAALTSFDADGFTLAWSLAIAARPMGYLALGGDLEVFVGAGPTIPTSGGSVSITGCGFEPLAVILMHVLQGVTPSAAAASAGFGFGVADALAQACIYAMSFDGTGNTQAQSGFSASQLASGDVVADSGPTMDFQTALASLDADGFTLSISQNPGTNPVATSYAAFRGVQVKAGSFTKPTSAGTQGITGVGFTPKAIIFFNERNTAQVQNDVLVGVGLSDGTNESCIASGDLDGAGTTITRRFWDSDQAITVLAGNPPAVVANADVQSLDSDGFTLDWIASDAVASPIGFLAFGDPAASGQAFWLTTL